MPTTTPTSISYEPTAENITTRKRKKRGTAEERFWPKVNKTDICWLWVGYLDRNGYGVFSGDGEVLAHRYSYRLLVGPIPDGFFIDHLCRIKDCVRPEHLQAVSPKENTGRGIRSRRSGMVTSGPSRSPDTKKRMSNVGKICDVDWCDVDADTRGWCRKHYVRWRNTGDPLGVLSNWGKSLEERLWMKVDKEGPVSDCRPDLGHCWIWNGSKSKDYGRILAHGKTTLVHRVSYELLMGAIPEGLKLDHLCRTTLCVNPSHLEPVTQKENVLRGFGACAIHARKTHCLRGHEFNEVNTRIRPDGGRECRVCQRQRYHDNKNKELS